MGKTETTSLDSFYNNKIKLWYQKKQDKKRLNGVIQEIHSKGNASKHDERYELEDAKQLSKDFKILEEFIIKCIDDIHNK